MRHPTRTGWPTRRRCCAGAGRRSAGGTAALADGLERPAAVVPGADGAAPPLLLDAVLPAVAGCGDRDRAARAEQLLWSGQYLGDVDRLRGELTEPAAQVAAARSAPWWRR